MVKFLAYVAAFLVLMDGTALRGYYFLGSTPGNFSLANNATYQPTQVDDAIILITSSNVTLDFGGNWITQADLTQGCNGVVINPGLNNIVIRNGIIRDITGNGIVIGAGCSDITLENIATVSCDLRAISCVGTPIAPINGVGIEEFSAGGCGEGATADFAMSFSECLNIQANSVEIASCGIPTHDYSGLMLFDVCCSKFNGITIDSNYANGINRAYDLTNVTDSIFSTCFSRGGSVNSGGTCIGFDLQSFCSHVSFNDCIVLSPSATGPGAEAYGFRFQPGNDDNLMRQCIVSNASGDFSATGILMEGNENAIIECIIQDCTSTIGTAIGIAYSSANKIKTIDCLSVDHESTGEAMGYYFSNCTDCFTQLSVVSNVTGGTDAQTFGFYLSGGSGNVFLSNVAARNGSSTNNANQFFGLNAFSQSVVSVNTSGPGNVTAPWVNIGLI